MKDFKKTVEGLTRLTDRYRASYDKALLKAKELDRDLTAYDERFKNMLEIRHADGSFLLLKNAFAEIHRIDGTLWQLIFTEHMGIFVFCDEDVLIENLK